MYWYWSAMSAWPRFFTGSRQVGSCVLYYAPLSSHRGSSFTQTSLLREMELTLNGQPCDNKNGVQANGKLYSRLFATSLQQCGRVEPGWRFFSPVLPFFLANFSVYAFYKVFSARSFSFSLLFPHTHTLALCRLLALFSVRDHLPFLFRYC